MNSLKRVILLSLPLCVMCFSLYRIIDLSWCSDDAFISFRYAQNLIDGHGLVYNVGEYVEGYTNFLWTVLIAGGMFVGIEPVLFTIWMGVISFIGCTIVCFSLEWRTGNEKRSTSFLVLPATLGLLLHHDMQVWATSGLETMFTTTLVLTAFLLLVQARAPRTYLWAGVVSVMAVMSRPDALIFLAMSVLYILVSSEHRRIHLTRYLLPVVLVLFPYWVIKYQYYGYPFPNSYYAKSADLPYFSQGWKYIWLYFKSYYALLTIVFSVAVTIWIGIKKIKERTKIMGTTERVLILGMFLVIPYVVYIARVGGDFMFARFLIPITPIVLLMISASIGLAFKVSWLRTVVGALLVFAIIFRNDLYHPPEKSIDGIAYERIHYPSELIKNARIEGNKIKSCLSGLDVSGAFYGKKAMLAYYSQIHRAIEAAASLTDEEFAHRPIQKRGRTGHEKRMPYKYLVERKVNFILGGTFQSHPDPNLPGVISFDGVTCHIVTYQREIMDHLKRRPEVKFIDFPLYLDNYIKGLDTVSVNQLERDMAFFQEYYFAHNKDTKRLSPFLNRLKH